MSVSKQRLYDLLPAYVRFRDQQLRDPEFGIAPLEALIKSLELPLHAIEENVDALYRGWFVETCDLWKVPYIADLLGVRGLDEADALIPSQRARVANTIAYRRRKGTPAALARAAADATGWPCHARVLREITATTRALGTPAAERGGTLDLRDDERLANLDTPFDDSPHTADLAGYARRDEHGSTRRGCHPNNIGLTFWRLESYPVQDAPARAEAGAPRQRFRFHPSGVDTQLFNPGRTVDGVSIPEPDHLPVPIGRLDLAGEIAARREGKTSRGGFLGSEPAFRIRVRESKDGEFRPVAPQEMEVADLSDWSLPRTLPPGVRVLVDPETGRFLFTEPGPEREAKVDYCYGFSDDVGGGPYPRRNLSADPALVEWQAIVDSDPLDESDDPHCFRSLAEALSAWREAGATHDRALIRIDDSAFHEIGTLDVDLPAKHRLTIQAEQRRWPHLVGKIAVGGEIGSRLELDGVAVEGSLELRDRPSLRLRHSTVHPPAGQELAIDYPSGEAGSRRFDVAIENSIVTGAIRLPLATLGLRIADSIVDAGGGEAIRGTPASGVERPETGWIGPPAHIERSTILGGASLQQLWHASNALFTAPVVVARPREGRARYSFFHNDSVTPPRESSLEGPRAAAGRRLRPAFTSTSFGHPGYAQLSPCSAEIRRGGEQGNEIGVFHRLRQGDRAANLDALLDEYLPAGFNTRISYAS